MAEFPVATTRSPGIMAVDWEDRVDFNRLREHRLARVRSVLDRFELGAAPSRHPTSATATSTTIGYWAFNKGERWALVN